MERISDIWFMNTGNIGVWLFCLLLCSKMAFSQQYFKLLEKPGKSYGKKIARFSNGDILIGDSPISGETADQSGGINITRLDQCGNVRWAMNYQWKRNFVKFEDFKINHAGEIFVYGTCFEPPNNEYIFLLKLNGYGAILGFRVIHGGTVDNFTYNIELHDNEIMAYGLLLDWNTPKRGFIAIFDDKLNFQWGTKFAPFESDGQAIMTDDNGFLCRAGLYLIKLNAQGNLDWAKTFEDVSALYPIGGPFAVDGGYVFESHNNNYAFFYKIDGQGNLLWKSAQFSSTNQAADVKSLADGSLLGVYNCPDGEKNYPCQILLAPDGNIISQQKLVVDRPLHISTIYQSISKSRNVNILGTTDVQTDITDSISGFLMQFPLGSSSGKCFQWESFQSLLPNDIDMRFIPLDVTFYDLFTTNLDATAVRDSQVFVYREICDLSANNIIIKDTSLLCGQSWQISLPSPQFTWEDEAIDNPRTLDQTGIYRASDNNCLAPITYEYHVRKEPCQCSIYLPTAFSPNNDGINDRLEIFSNCTFQEVQMAVYNRWGDKVFASDATNVNWDGRFRQKVLEDGIYIAVVHYKLLNDNNEVQEGNLVQNIMLLK